MARSFSREGTNAISPSLEDYLAAIYVLLSEGKQVRITDISRYLGISKPSANRAVNSLKNQGYAEHEPYGDIFLTEQGYSYAGDLYRRRALIKRFLSDVLGVDREDAEREACMLEHSVSQSTLEKIERFLK